MAKREHVSIAKALNFPEGHFYRKIAEFELHLINTAMFEAKGNMAAAARLLGICRTTLVEKCKRYGVKKGGVYGVGHEKLSNGPGDT